MTEKPTQKPFNSRIDMIFWHVMPGVVTTLSVSAILGALALFWGLPAVVSAVQTARDDPFTGTQGRALEVHIETQMAEAHKQIADSIERLTSIVQSQHQRLRDVELEQARREGLFTQNENR